VVFERCGCPSCVSKRRTASAQICLYSSSATPAHAAADIDAEKFSGESSRHGDGDGGLKHLQPH
ncbi:unnamed protein product, partial [Ectocarpus fasciculatus]